MSNINEEARIPVYLNDEQAKAALKSLQAEADKWRTKMQEAMAGGDLKGMKAAERELRKANMEASKLRKAAFDTNKVLENLSTASYKDLRNTLRQLSREQENLNRKSKEWKTYQRNIRLVRAEMNKVNGSLQTHGSFLSKASNSFNKYFGIASAGIATLTGVVFSVKEWTKGLVDLDDALADVMKTTGLTRTEVRGMYTDFRYLNTRTPRKELLLLAEEAGRLGIKGRQNIEDFVEVANKIKVALGDDLGGEAEVAIREVGKLVEIYKVGNEYGTSFKESLNKVGSAINEVSANSNSQAEYQIGFLKRMGGTATQAKISAANILGYASTLDQLGQSQEMAATALGKTIVSMFKDSASYAKVAKMEVGDFSRLLQTDANAALLAVLDGLNGNNEGFAIMATKLDELGVDGARAVQVLAALSSNTKMAREQQKLANKAMEEGTSLSNEYNIKNNNLAGSMDKIGRAIRSHFVNSNFLQWMEKVVAKAAEWTEVPLSEKIRNEQTELNLLVASITNVNNTQETRNTLIAELQEKYPDFLSNLDTEKLSNEQLRDRLKEVNEQYENKILLAVKEDKLQENYKDRTDLKLRELKLIQEIAKKELEITDLKKQQSEFSPTTPQWTEYSRQIFQAETDHRNFNRQLDNTREKFAELQQEEIELNAALKELMTTVTGVTGASSTGVGTGTGGTGNGGTGTGSAGKGSSLFDFTPETEAPLEMENWMTNDKWDKYGAEEFAARKASEEEWTAFLKKQIDERVSAEAKALEIEKEVADARIELKEIQVAAIGQLANSLAGAFEQGSAMQIAMIAIEKAIAIAEIWINLAKQKSAIALAAANIAAMPIPGARIAAATYEAAMTAKALTVAKINTGLVVAQTVASAVSSGKRGKTQKYEKGKYPVPLRTGTYGDRPHYALFNEVPGYPEMVVDGRTFKTMQDYYPELINAVYSIAGGKSPGKFVDGKYPDQNLTQPYTPGMDAKTAQDLTTALNRFINKKLVVDIRTIKKELDSYADMLTNMGM